MKPVEIWETGMTLKERISLPRHLENKSGSWGEYKEKEIKWEEKRRTWSKLLYQTRTSNEGLTSFTRGLLMMFLALDAYLNVLMVSL